ncbi:RNAse E [Sphingomonas laterariae]|uniref:Ribonuclease E n=1 Tax=Edaphosphingomonas laterariae TaxID=861865 RepID=A0A239F230_9SPHN|nr:ribonuclease E/G [Sphingomonas laterariae]SNS50895.1 RNAse E [Sphingomonas laterariae]
MTMRMLIDARHREETRVAVVKGNRIEEFDFESAERKQLKGNIYLAKVTRVEPSLQAAFVDYGGNRHGFLAFSEIHPDYYQIPKEDRDALLREEAEHAAEEEALRQREEAEYDHHDDEDHHDDDHADDGEHHGEDGEETPRRKPTSAGGGDENAVEALRTKRMNLRRRYKIQDVIRRRQVLLVQVVKEERGNKGAALTTYLSLAGRYCVLMPNTAHGGGISRKISNAADRKRLKSIMAELNLPKTMGCIVRTAGLQRTKTEIKRDFDYLARLWDEIRENTLNSEAPALVYGDSDLIKRAIRDIYNRDIDEVIVEGEDGYRAARSFMKLLMPSHTKKIAAYSDAVPLFQRFGVEDQLAAMYQPIVQLKSGGYLVINPTEALVSIDINSGRSTREHNIEQTALSTNLEAAHEIARQLRLRDMAGLVVIDFIDMESNSNNRKVEKAMKEALKNDRARIQVGRISSFGLFEMSRQRLRTGVLEASTRQCPHCEGTGLVRTASSAGLSALRMLEDEAARGRGSRLVLRASQEASLYVLNRKRAEISEIEERYGVLIEILSDGSLEGARMTVESSGPPPAYAPRLPQPIAIEPEDDDILDIEDEEEEEEIGEEADAETARDARDGGEERNGRRRRRRRRRGGRREDGEGVEREAEAEAGEADEAGEAETAEDEAELAADAADDAEATADAEGERGDGRRRRGRRGRRGGRRRGGEEGVTAEGEATEAVEDEAAVEPAEAVAVEEPAPTVEEAAPAPAEATEEEAPAKPRARRRPRARKETEAEVAVTEAPVEVAPEPVAEAEPAEKPKRTRRKAAPKKAEVVAEAAAEAEAPAATEEAPAKPKRRTTRAKAAAAPAKAEAVAEAPAEPTPEPVAAEAGAPRRGWWQRTFGN